MKKILLRLLIIILMIGVLTTATGAYFSNEGTSSDNTFTTGTLNLKLDGADDVTATWTMSNMAPGDSVSADIDLTNTGTITADHVEVSEVVNVVADANNDADPDIETMLEITALTYDGVSILAALVDANANGWIDLGDLANSFNSGDGGILDGLTAPAAGGADTKVFSMTILFRTEAGNEYQGDSNAMSITFQLNQDASQ